MVNFWILEQYSEVVRTQSFSRAARNLNVSLSALSRNISQLERDLKVQLLVREKANTLTPAGKIVYRYASSQLQMHQEMLEELQGLKRTGVNTLLIQDLSVMPQLASILRDAIAGLHVDYPYLNVQMKPFHGKSIEDALLDGDLDMIFLFRLYCDDIGSPLFNDDRVASMELKPYDNPIIVGIPKSNPLAQGGAIPAEELNRLEFAKAADIAMDHYFASFWRALNQRGITPRYSMVAVENDLTELYFANIENLALTASQSLYDNNLIPATTLEKIAFVDVAGLDTRQHLYVLWRKNDENLGIAPFLKKLTNVFEALVREQPEQAL